MAVRIIPRIVRGRVFYPLADIPLLIFVQAAGAWSAVAAHRLDIISDALPVNS